MAHPLRNTLLFVCLLLTAAYLLRGTLAMSVMERALPKLMASDSRDDLSAGLHVGVCGAGGPMPDAQRSGACLIVMAGESLLMVDSGSGGPRNIGRMRFPIGDIDAVLLTHFHSDHIDALGETATLRWASAANTTPLTVIGPTGVTAVVEGFNKAYTSDTVYRHAHHGDTVAPLSGKGLSSSPFVVPAIGESEVVWDQAGLKVIAFQVKHDPVKPSVGYRFDYAGRSVVVSGDTAPSKNLELFAQGADLLLHEALSRTLVATMQASAKTNKNEILEKIFFDIQDYHTSPTEAAAIAQAAGVSHLAYYHIVPPLMMPGLDQVFLKGVDEIYDGPTTLSVDGAVFSLPANSSEVLLVKKGL